MESCAGAPSVRRWRRTRNSRSGMRVKTVGTLGVALTDPAVRPRVVDACCSLVDAEVAARSGVTGLAVRAGYRAVSSIRPRMMRDAVDHLLPDFAAALEPLHAEAPGSAFEPHLRSNGGRAAEALLDVMDGRVEHAKSAITHKTYARFATDRARAARGLDAGARAHPRAILASRHVVLSTGSPQGSSNGQLQCEYCLRRQGR